MLPNNLVKTKKLCAEYLVSCLNLSAFSQTVHYIKFTTSIQAEDKEVTVKVSGEEPEIIGYLHPIQKNICNRFPDAKNFSVSLDSVLHFTSVSNNWVYGVMVLSPLAIEEKTEPAEPLENTTKTIEVAEDNTLEPEILEQVESISESPKEINESSEIPEIIESSSVVVEEGELDTAYISEVTKTTFEIVPVAEDTEPLVIPEPMGVYISLPNSEGRQIKKRLDVSLSKITPLLTGWLFVTEQLREFKVALDNTPHNALTLYLNPPIVWYVQDVETTENITLDTYLLRETKALCDELKCSRIDDILFDKLKATLDPTEFRKLEKIKNSIVNKESYHNQTIEVKKVSKQLRQKGQASEGVAEIRPRGKGSIQRNKRVSIPELDNIWLITPIKEEIDGQTYLVQEYIEKTDTNFYQQKSRRIALFDGGQLLYYNDLQTHEQDLHEICPLIEVDGVKIFPSQSINQVKLETLECENPKDPPERHIYRTKMRSYFVDKFGVKHPYDEATEVPERIESSFYHPAVTFNRVLPPPPDTTKKVKRVEKTERKTPKPIKLENEKVVSGSATFYDVIGTVPCLLKLNPSITGYTLTALPVKLPDSYCYHLARYIAGNVPRLSGISYLHKEIQRLKNISSEFYGGIPRTSLISMLTNLLDGLVTEKKIDPKNFLESKNKLKERLKQAQFLTSSTNPYYGFYELAKVSVVEEVEDQKYTYKLTNQSTNDAALIRHNLPSVLNWIRRVTYNLREYFGIKKPDIREIRNYLESTFNYFGCKLSVYYDKRRKGIYIEIEHKGQVVSEHHLDIIDPANTEQRYSKKNEKGEIEKHDRNYGIVPTRLAITTAFNEHNNKEVFRALLRCSLDEMELVNFSESQLRKVINKYITANRSALVGEGKITTPTKVTQVAGFIDTGHGYSAIKKTFLKFIRPFTSESAVNLGKVIDLTTLKPYSEHDSTHLLEKITANWKKWTQKDDLEVILGGQSVGKKNPAKLMLNVHNLLDRNPQLDSLVWGDLIDTFYQLSGLSIGFRCSNGVILTPWTIYTNDIERWEHRIKIQLISVIRDNIRLPHPTDKGKTVISGIESLLQKEIGDRVSPEKGSLYSMLYHWLREYSKDRDIKKHLTSLHDELDTIKSLANDLV